VKSIDVGLINEFISNSRRQLVDKWVRFQQTRK